LWTTANGGKLYMKKKAPYRDKISAEDMLIYIMMWRTEIIAEHKNGRSNVEKWKEWLAEKDENKTLGYNVSDKIRQLVETRIEKVEDENRRIKNENAALLDIKKLLDTLGIDPNSWNAEERLREQAERLKTIVPKDFVSEVERLKNNCEKILSKIGG